MAKSKYQFTITYESTIDTETGEVLDTVIVEKSGNKKSSSKKSKVPDDGDTPTLTLEDTKYQLNAAAIRLMEVEADDKLDIRYTDSGKPVLVIDEKGNRLTKTGTVSFRGSKNEELSKHGTVFTISKENDGFFSLDSGEKQEVIEDDNISVDDLSLEDFIDEPEATEVDSKALFQL